MQYTLCDSRLPVRPRPIWPLSIFIIDMVISYEIYSEQLRKQEAQLPQRDSASAAHVFLGSLTDRALH